VRETKGVGENENVYKVRVNTDRVEGGEVCAVYHEAKEGGILIE